MSSDAGNAAEKGNVIESLGVGGLQRRLPGFDSSRLENCVVQHQLVIIMRGGDPNRAIYERKTWSSGERQEFKQIF